MPFQDRHRILLLPVTHDSMQSGHDIATISEYPSHRPIINTHIEKTADTPDHETGLVETRHTCGAIDWTPIDEMCANEFRFRECGEIWIPRTHFEGRYLIS